MHKCLLYRCIYKLFLHRILVYDNKLPERTSLAQRAFKHTGKLCDYYLIVSGDGWGGNLYT